MKRKVLILLLLLAAMFNGYSQVFEVEPIKISGSDDKRINLVVLSEGYQSSEFTDFIDDVISFSNAMFSQSPFAEYANYFNVYAIKVPSNESGADHPATATDVDESGITPVFVDTYFNATFDAFGYHRYLYYGIDYADAASAEAKIRSVLADNFPTYDQALIFVNTSDYGGTGGEFPIASANADGNEIAIHELGHSMFGLKDEYYPGDLLAGEAINMTQETNTDLVKWKNWLSTNGIGIYQYYDSTGEAKPWYRPHQTCKMRYLGYPFCSVCKEGMVEVIHGLISPVETYSPAENSVDSSSFPIDFQLSLILPDPDTLELSWTLNGTDFANDVDGVSVEETNLVEGENTLTAVVYDNSPLLRVDNHESIHVTIVNWTINYSTLGVEDLESSKNNISINMYPNPSNSTVNFKFENDKYSNLKINIVGLDGKTVKNLFVANYNTQQVDIANLQTGVYLVNFYANNVLVASKKLIKQ